jgi:hypothetical protein
MADSAVWVAVVSGVSSGGFGLAGYVFAGRNDERRDKAAAERERLARLETREDRLADERQAFQREVLLDLQERLRMFTRTTTQVLMQDRRTLKDKGELYLLPDGMSDDHHKAGVAFMHLKERVLSDELRVALSGLYEFGIGVEIRVMELRGSPADLIIGAIDAMNLELAQRHQEVNKLLGVELRKVLGRRA